MTTKNCSMMVIGMMILGTTYSFGSTPTKNSHFQTTKIEKVVGGYSQQRNLTKQDKQLFKNTYNGKDKLTPVSVSTQVVNGTNYKFICKDKNGRKVTVIIYQSLPCYGGKSKVVSVN